MSEVTGVIKAVSTKDVAIKKGPKAGSVGKVFSLRLDDNEWYSCGFKSPPEKGSTVTIQFEDNAYGHQVKNIAIVDAAPSSGGSSGGSVVSEGKGFPIGPRANSRAINRQNALTNAVSYVAKIDITDKSVATVIAIARQFEAYTTGDLDVLEARRLAEGDSPKVED